MGLIKTVRPSEGSLLRAVTLYQCDAPVADVAVPDESWDIVVMKKEGRVQVLLTGQTTRAVALPFGPGDEYLTLSFRPHTFLSRVPAGELLDQGLLLPVSASRFRLGDQFWEFPSFDDAEAWADRLARSGLLDSDEVVRGLLDGHPLAMSPRSVQRHFQRTTGMPAHAFYQIRRAHQAAQLLLQGEKAVDAALELGYSDQPHMIRSLKRVFGKTPSELLRVPDHSSR